MNSTTRYGAVIGVALSLAALPVLMLLGIQRADARTETVLYSFNGNPDGAGPGVGTPVLDKDGNLYGTTLYGGAYNLGTVWKVTPAGTETVLWSFGNGADGATPNGVVMDNNGNLFGTTSAGGTDNLGLAFELTAAGTETILWNFGKGMDGAQPDDAPVLDSAGNIYGTTWAGGIHGYGTVFELAPSGTETILWNFLGTTTDQGHPIGFMLAANGNIFGISFGQSDQKPHYSGQVWEVMGRGVESVLYSFVPPPNGVDGELPEANVVMDNEGNLFGNCHIGGVYVHGTVFKLTPSGTETILHAFKDKKDGSEPYNNITMDKKGNLYSVTSFGGASKGGTVWKMSPSGKETVLHAFPVTGTDGTLPFTGVVLDSKGNVYGTTQYGGNRACRLNGQPGCGVVYKISP